MTTKMEKALNAFVKEGYNLLSVWNDDEVENYPDYMPSFDEFLMDIETMRVKKMSIIEVIADDGKKQIFSLRDVNETEPMTKKEWMEALVAIGYTRSGIVEIK